MNLSVYEAFVITRPSNTNRLLQLRAKLSEYSLRIDSQIKSLEKFHPNLDLNQTIAVLCHQSSSYYKLSLLSEILEFGNVQPWYLKEELEKENIRHFSSIPQINNYLNACLVIKDYCQTGGKKNFRGTGLVSIQ